MGNIEAIVTDPPYGKSISLTSERTTPTASINAHSASILVLEIEFGSFVESFVFDIKKPPKIIAGGDIKTASLRRYYPVQVMRVRYRMIPISAKAPLAKTILYDLHTAVIIDKTAGLCKWFFVVC